MYPLTFYIYHRLFPWTPKYIALKLCVRYQLNHFTVQWDHFSVNCTPFPLLALPCRARWSSSNQWSPEYPYPCLGDGQYDVFKTYPPSSLFLPMYGCLLIFRCLRLIRIPSLTSIYQRLCDVYRSPICWSYSLCYSESPRWSLSANRVACYLR